MKSRKFLEVFNSNNSFLSCIFSRKFAIMDDPPEGFTYGSSK